MLSTRRRSSRTWYHPSLEDSRIQRGGTWWVPRADQASPGAGYRPPMALSHLNHPMIQGGPWQHLTTSTSSAPQSPSRARHLPHGTSCSRHSQNPLGSVEKDTDRRCQLEKLPWEVLPGWEPSPGTRSIPDEHGGSSGSADKAQQRPCCNLRNKGAALAAEQRHLYDKPTSWDSPGRWQLLQSHCLHWKHKNNSFSTQNGAFLSEHYRR